MSWRIVSAIDGHVTAGACAFGVRVAPTGTAAAATTMMMPLEEPWPASVDSALAGPEDMYLGGRDLRALNA